MGFPPVPGQSAALHPANRPVEYSTLAVKALLRQTQPEGAQSWHWTMNPYVGCEFACTWCDARLYKADPARWTEFSSKVKVKVNAVERLLAESRSDDFRGRPLVIGSHTEPWQQAEERFRLTRSLLEVLTRMEGLDIRIKTRSSLIARDSDLLRTLAQKNRVTVSFSLATLDERIGKLMEPGAPSAFRRLAALEALCRVGLNVGLIVSPVLPGLDDRELDLGGLLGRASSAGARFAGIEFLKFGLGQREAFLKSVTAAFPEAGARFRRLVGVKPLSEERRQFVQKTFETHCRMLGLSTLEQAVPALPPGDKVEAPAQLTLFAH